MKNLRAALAALAVALLTAGWAGAAWAAMNETAPDWAARMDLPPIRTLALVLLVAAVGLAFVPDRESETEESGE